MWHCPWTNGTGTAVPGSLRDKQILTQSQHCHQASGESVVRRFTEQRTHQLPSLRSVSVPF